jgi:hypothetical protein
MKTLLLSLLLLFAAACEREGPAERAGEKIDRAGEAVRDAATGNK